MDLTLEIVEGPGAGWRAPLRRAIVVGRDPTADLSLEDTQASRHHARITPEASGAVVEDLDSTNGTFINGSEIHGSATLAPGDELVVGVTVLQLGGAAQPSAVRALPPALAAAPGQPSFVKPVASGGGPEPAGVPGLDRLVDAKTKSRARLAPLAIFVLVALVVLIYLGTQ